MCDGHSDVPVTLPDGRVVDVDGYIAGLVRVLNELEGYETVASCCGHEDMATSIALADGRWLVIVDERSDYNRIMEPFEARHLASRVSQLESESGQLAAARSINRRYRDHWRPSLRKPGKWECNRPRPSPFRGYEDMTPEEQAELARQDAVEAAYFAELDGEAHHEAIVDGAEARASDGWPV